MSCQNLVGQRFGSLVVLERDYNCSRKYVKWWCKCDCGCIKSIYNHSLLKGKSTTCGAGIHRGKKGINQTHGMSKTRLYHEWHSMRRRCKPNTPDAHLYYNRGITVCDEWDKDFVSFQKWAMANGYSNDLTLDRIDNYKGYSPDNCRWITNREQQLNKRNSIIVTYNGKKYALSGLCEEIGFPYGLAHRRYKTMKDSGVPIDMDKILAPSRREKIPKKYRKESF